MSDRQKLIYALLASAFLHLAFVLVLGLWGVQHAAEVAKALPDLSQLTVTIMPPRPAAPPAAAGMSHQKIVMAPTPPPAHPVRPVLDSAGLTPSSKAPAHAIFQSDANMIAGSQLPATGDLPLPSQNGPNRKFTDFANQAASFGKGQTPIQSNPARHPAQAAQPSQAVPVPPAAAPTMLEQSPSAITQVQHSSTPASTPVPKLTPAPTAAPDTLALGKPTPTPVSTPVSTPIPAASPLPTPVAELARLSLRGHADIAPMARVPAPPPSQAQPPSAPSSQPSMQREAEKTRVDGGIATPGRPGVDAIETPFGRYHHKLFNLIGSRWKLYLQQHPKDVGDVTILVMLNPSGKVAATRVMANHSLDDLAALSTRAIMESDLPPVPDDLAPMLRNGKLEVSFNFNVYDASNDSPGR